MYAATKWSIAETFKAAKLSFETATHAERNVIDCTDAVLEVHDKLQWQQEEANQAMCLVAADTVAQQQV